MIRVPFNPNFDEGVKIAQVGARSIERFVHVPVDWVRLAQESGGRFAVVTAMVVWFRHCVTKSETVTVSNAAAKSFVLGRKQKTAGLQALARAGLISIHQTCGASPVVTILETWQLSGQVRGD